MKKPIGLLLVSLVITQTGPVFAQDSLLEYLIDACEEDLAQYCSQVTPGEGRLLHCVAAHEDKLSGQCDYALYQAASLLEQLSVAIAYVASSCSTEIATLCSDVQAGEGQILACLEDNGDQLGNPCKKAIADTTGE